MEIKVKRILNGAFNKLLDNFNLLSEELSILSKKRADICKDCELCYFDNKLQSLRCGKCGCFINWKVSNKEEKCPEGKW